MTMQWSRRGLLASGIASAPGIFPCSWLRAEDPVTSDHKRLKITAVKTYVLSHELKQPFGVSVSVPLDKTRTAMMVKIETNEGLVGWGETAPITGARGTITDHLAPKLLGRNPMHYRSIVRGLWGPNFGNALSVGALEMAINDIRGKALGLPVCDLFGGRHREKVPVYASAMNYLKNQRPEDHYPQEAEVLVKQGVRALKMRLGRYPVRRESKIAASVRETVGRGITLMADGNAAYTMKTALDMGDRLHELDFAFWEEPLPQSPNYAGYEVLRDKLRLPLAGGEAVDTRANAKRLLDRGAFDIIQPDVSLCGGIGEVLFIAELAALSGVRCIPHCWGGAILIAATLHLLAILPDPHWGFETDTPMLEWDRSENPWRTDIVSQPFVVKEGSMAVPTVPGLGVEVDEKAIQRYAIRVS
ncbi:MAG: mandelate racemase/muconate lactonizing enzyme family protein [Planctomycetota bacterium]|nr:mandelate racemase/muconate lactonizing enzyme family protein [Planctomycetota bacterium]